jgi:hypothetical protein
LKIMQLCINAGGKVRLRGLTKAGSEKAESREQRTEIRERRGPGARERLSRNCRADKKTARTFKLSVPGGQ